MINVQQQMIELVGRSVVRGLLITDKSMTGRKIAMIKAVRFTLHAAGLESTLRQAKEIVESELIDWQLNVREEEFRVTAIHASYPEFDAVEIDNRYA
jgi:hypothetical protein